MKVVKTYIDGGYRACLLVDETDDKYHLIPFDIGVMKLQKVERDDYKLLKIDNQSQALSSFRRCVGQYGGTNEVKIALGLMKATKKKRSAKKKKKAASKKKSSSKK